VPYPFRNPVDTDDDSSDNWSPPSYAVPVDSASNVESSDNSWKPPSYATLKQQKPAEKEKTPLRKAIDFIKPPERLNPSAIPGYGLATSEHPLTDIENATKSFLDNHPRIKEAGKRLLTGTSPEFEAQMKAQGVTDVKGPGLMEVPGATSLSNKIRNAATKSGNYWVGAAGSVIGDILEGAASGFDPRVAGKPEESLPIKRPEGFKPQSKELTYRPTEEELQKTPASEVKKATQVVEQPPVKQLVNPFESLHLPPEFVAKGGEEEFNKSAQEAIQAEQDKAKQLSPEQRGMPTSYKGIDVTPGEKPTEKLINPDTGREWQPPGYATLSEEPQFAKTSEGKLAIGADVKSLGKVLGTSLYKGDIAPIATKELLQNSIDATRHLGAAGKIDVIFNKPENAIHVHDNGKGLTKEELEHEYTDLGASGKRGDVRAAGGFGLAKAAPLLGGEHVEVSSIALDPKTGKLMRNSFQGTPDELIEGVDIKQEVVPKGTQTGTQVKVKVPKDSSIYEAERFVQNLTKHSPDVQADIRSGTAYTDDLKDVNLKSYPKGKGTVLATLDNPSAQTSLIIPNDSTRATRSSMKVHLSNNGMYQGSSWKYFNSDIPNIPSDLVVDIKSKVPEGHGDYPFTANRESMRGTVEDQVNQYIDDNLVRPAIGKRADELKRLYNSMPEITVGQGGAFPHNFGHKISLYDPKGQITPNEMKEITENPSFQTLTSNIALTLKNALSAQGNEAWSDKLEKLGIIFEDKLHGIHIPNPGTKKSAILINPFISIDKLSPDEASANILHTILHEIGHIDPYSPGHNELFTIRLGDIYAKFGARRSVEAQDQILKSLTGANPNKYSDEIQEVLSTYKESRGREATTEDLLSGTGIGSRTPTGGEGNIPPGGESNGEGDTRNAVNKLFSALSSAKESNVEQQAINRAERARRFAAFEGVKQGGAEGAAKSLSKLRGEFEKVEPGEGLNLESKDVDSLFTAVKRANITSGEKARGYTALFALLNGDRVPVRSELSVLDNVFGNGFTDRITEMQGGIGAVGLKVSKLANTMKSMQNAMSLAAPLRHGIGLVARKEFYPAFVDMFKFFASKNTYKAAMKAIEERPNYLLGRDAGLFTARPGSLLNSEEEFLKSYIGKIPIARNIVAASRRGYTGFLNKLRSDTFDSMVQQAKDLGNDVWTEQAQKPLKSGKPREPIMIASPATRAIARFINNATGRGDLPFGLNKMTNELNTVLWSPRMLASRITMFTDPTLYTNLPKGMRREGIKSLLGIAALGTTIDTLASLGGAKITTNILSTDFMKARFGKHVIDPWASFQQQVVATARFLAGKTQSPTPTTRKDIAERFITNKLSPAASLAYNLATAKKFTGGGNFTTQYGEKTNIAPQVLKQFTPIFIQDLYNIVKDDPDWAENIGLTSALVAASAAGMEQDYNEPPTGKLAFRRMRP
jgi:Histidine kinase-, DNA gyrase B-, and HSP90-like ATPase